MLHQRAYYRYNRDDQNIMDVQGRLLTRREWREEFPPEFTDEKRNEWLKWIEERSKQYSIEPVTEEKIPDPTGIVVYSTRHGTLEVQEHFVKKYVTKPVDSIMKARGLRGPLIIDKANVTNKARSTKLMIVLALSTRFECSVFAKMNRCLTVKQGNIFINRSPNG